MDSFIYYVDPETFAELVKIMNIDVDENATVRFKALRNRPDIFEDLDTNE